MKNWLFLGFLIFLSFCTSKQKEQSDKKSSFEKSNLLGRWERHDKEDNEYLEIEFRDETIFYPNGENEQGKGFRYLISNDSIFEVLPDKEVRISKVKYLDRDKLIFEEGQDTTVFRRVK